VFTRRGLLQFVPAALLVFLGQQTRRSVDHRGVARKSFVAENSDNNFG
jgi:hypothetical protein